MATTDRSTITGAFENRAQAEKVVTELKQAGFSDDLIGLAGRDEVLEKLETDALTRTSSEHVVVAVQAGERWQEAVAILQRNGAFNMVPSPEEPPEEQVPANQQVETNSVEPHLEYDPVTGPRLTTENIAPLASGGYGLERDPAVDAESPTSDPNVRANIPEEEQEKGDTIFEQTIEPLNREPGSPDDPNL